MVRDPDLRMRNQIQSRDGWKAYQEHTNRTQRGNARRKMGAESAAQVNPRGEAGGTEPTRMHLSMIFPTVVKKRAD